MKRKSAASLPEPPKNEARNALYPPQKKVRRRALLAGLASLVLLIGCTIGFSALFSRLSTAAILYANAGSFALGLALTLACAALIALLPTSDAEIDRAASARTAHAGRASLLQKAVARLRAGWTLPLGALVAGTEIGLFLLTGSARIAHGRAGASTVGVWLALWLDAGLALYPALWICGILPLFAPTRFPRLRRLFPLMGAALEAGWLIYARGCTAWTFVLNALLLGGLTYTLSERARGWLSAAAGVFAFFAAERLFGEAAPVYPVSEPFLTGAESGGLFGSPVLTVFLLFWGLIVSAKRARIRSVSRDTPNSPTESGGRMQ